MSRRKIFQLKNFLQAILRRIFRGKSNLAQSFGKLGKARFTSFFNLLNIFFNPPFTLITKSLANFLETCFAENSCSNIYDSKISQTISLSISWNLFLKTWVFFPRIIKKMYFYCSDFSILNVWKMSRKKIYKNIK